MSEPRNTNRQQKTSANPKRHGLTVMKNAMKTLGNRAIDGRTRAGKALAAWRAGIVDDLGGPEAVSTAKLQLIDLAVQTKLLVDSIDAHLASLGDGVVNKRDRKVYPIVLQRNTLADSLVRQLQAIGLERKARPTATLEDYIAARSDE